MILKCLSRADPNSTRRRSFEHAINKDTNNLDKNLGIKKETEMYSGTRKYSQCHTLAFLPSSLSAIWQHCDHLHFFLFFPPPSLFPWTAVSIFPYFFSANNPKDQDSSSPFCKLDQSKSCSHPASTRGASVPARHFAASREGRRGGDTAHCYKTKKGRGGCPARLTVHYESCRQPQHAIVGCYTLPLLASVPRSRCGGRSGGETSNSDKEVVSCI